MLEINDKILKQENYLLWLAIKHHKTHTDSFLKFDNRPFLKYLYQCKAAYICVKKSTQCGVSEYIILREISKAVNGRSIFHVLPTDNLLKRYVNNRLNKSLAHTPYYQAIMKQTKINNKKTTDGIKLKNIGKGVITFVCSNSSANFAEFPADDVIVDEVDECNQEILPMAWERLSASLDPQQFKVSNPSVEQYGIDAEYNDSDQSVWMILCQCGEYVNPDFFRHIVKKVDKSEYMIIDPDFRLDSQNDINIICHKCGRPVNRFGNGIWVKQNSNSMKVGLEISKLFSSTVSIRDLVYSRFLPGLKNDILLQRFYNADLGLAYTADGAKVTRELILKSKGTHRNKTPHKGVNLIGIDVGAQLHIIILNLLRNNYLKMVFAGVIPVDFVELKKLYTEYYCTFGVIDGAPERSFSKLVKNSLPILACYYSDSKNEPLDQYKNVSVNRTASMDDVKTAYMNDVIITPQNIDSVDGFLKHMTNPTRVWNEERECYEWKKIKPDDFFHATNYALIARKYLATAKNI
jgi:hypothetical protein